MKKKKVVISQTLLFGFRVPLFNLISDTYDLSVVHGGYKKKSLTKCQFEHVESKDFRIGPFIYQRGLLSSLKGTDFVILMFDLRLISNIFAIIYCRLNKIPVSLWGIGFGKSKLGNKLRVLLSMFVNNIILYNNISKLEFKNCGVPESKLIVANNTVKFSNRLRGYESTVKNSILFVGALEERKGLSELISEYDSSSDTFKSIYRLNIVGSGPLETKLKNEVMELELSNVYFFGNINDEIELARLYEKAIFSISYKQAGLSVLQSLANGVPFISDENSITGGERYNVIDGVNGFLIGDNGEFKNLNSLFRYCESNADKFIRLGDNAYEYYDLHCSIENMKNEIFKAL